jgi:hypothetical protein
MLRQLLLLPLADAGKDVLSACEAKNRCHIQPKVSGEFPLPATSVKVGNQTLTTPGRCVSVRRAEVDITFQAMAMK